jgi:hypothetical protein
MVKPLTTLLAAGALAAATVSVPTQANAFAEWIIPAIIAAGVGGVAVGTVAANNAQGNVYVQPRAQASCHIVRERTASGATRRVEVCD